MTTSLHVQLPENNEISKVKKAALVFDCLEVSQGAQRTVTAQKGNPAQATVVFLVSVFVFFVFCFFELFGHVSHCLSETVNSRRASIENEISYVIYLISETRSQNEGLRVYRD